MKLRTKFLLFVGILHLLTLFLSFLIFRENKIVFILSEVFILISLWIATRLYLQLVQPLKMLVDGINAINDQDFNVKFRETGKPEVDQLIGVYNKMIDRLRAERTLQEEQHTFLEKLINTSPTGVVLLDLDQNIDHLNPRAMQLLEINENNDLATEIANCRHPLIGEIKELKAGESKVVSMSGVKNYKCQKSFFIDRGFHRYFVMLEELSLEILQTEKKAYGKVIRMMAHEVNNTIGPVNSIIDYAISKRGLQQDADDDLREALKVAIDRNNNLNIFMRNLADVVRLPQANRQALDVNQLLTSISKLFEFKAHEKSIQIRLSLAPKSLFINADIQQMEQVLINIIKNAIEAIDSNSGGVITLITLTDPARIIVRNTGIGIPDDIQVNLFTPFYTTKKDGQGIGLTLIREILINHGFEFSLKTNTEGFTDFVIFIRLI
ncbi:PAS domain-containing protein [Arcticibacter tournemirensis]|uniref:histidine kinase n=1 Tax=Arcticibacter tournemirensis TaxID=699437 RepID=A0A5M9H9R9_9SPHI|nr:ATP-binding protein [Arcticibacter tournemirensis]KAA8483672.1 HAMP domain-containing protein [Arcticibacter tournemirensis]TQM51368.1 PAS domain-containing protein [Arcticibacter tournemirensis]